MQNTVVFSENIKQIQHVKHAFTTRLGGDSQGAYASLNLAYHVDDDPRRVESNSEHVLECLGLKGRQMARLSQVHSSKVVKLDLSTLASEQVADACWTEEPTLVLCILVADCLPILLSDIQGSFVAAIHAGWRGTVERIAVKTVDTLLAAGKNVEEFRVALGPAIGPCCFDVDVSVAEKLKASTSSGEGVIPGVEPSKCQANLWEINKQQLLECGVPSGAIDVVRECTKCSKKYYSYRRDRGITGRQAGLIGFS